MDRIDRQIYFAGGWRYVDAVKPLAVRKNEGKFKVIFFTLVIVIFAVGMVISSVYHP